MKFNVKRLNVLSLNRFFIIILVLGFCSCGERFTIYKATLHNHSSSRIKILFYSGANVAPGDTIKLDPNEAFEFANGTDKGENIKAPGFSSKYFKSGYDTIKVIFNDSFKVYHFGETPTLFPEKYYINVSTRNISNPLSYEFKRTNSKKSEKGVWTNNHDYYFTVADYNFAKD